jgi:hypothetical protein
MTTARIAEQIVIEAPTKVGLLAEVTTALLGAGVNITAIMGHDMGAGAEIVVVTDDNERAAEALRRAGVTVHIEPVVVMTMPDEVGALNEAAQRIAEARVNIGWMYASVAADSSDVTVVFHTANDEKVVSEF